MSGELIVEIDPEGDHFLTATAISPAGARLQISAPRDSAAIKQGIDFLAGAIRQSCGEEESERAAREVMKALRHVLGMEVSGQS